MYVQDGHTYGNGHHTKGCSNHIYRRANIIIIVNSPKSQAKKMSFWGVFESFLVKKRNISINFVYFSVNLIANPFYNILPREFLTIH